MSAYDRDKARRTQGNAPPCTNPHCPCKQDDAHTEPIPTIDQE